MNITITRQQVTDAGACSPGLEWFDGTAIDGTISGEWTRETQLLAICLGAHKWWGWAVSAGLLPAWSMARANLSRANLSRANLSWADLRGADLSGADLSRADRFGDDHAISGWSVSNGRLVRP